LRAADGGVEGELDGLGDGETLDEGLGEVEVVIHATVNLVVHAATESTTNIGAGTADSRGELTGFRVGRVVTVAGFRTRYTTPTAATIKINIPSPTSKVFFNDVLIVLLLLSILGHKSECHQGLRMPDTLPSMIRRRQSRALL
jgi:hypothetical protein